MRENHDFCLENFIWKTSVACPKEDTKVSPGMDIESRVV